MIQLKNGATPLVWHVTHGVDDGLRPFIGRVLAHLAHNELHPYAVWSIFSDEGQEYACESGDYCATLDEAEQIFAQRARSLPRRGRAVLDNKER